MSVVTTMKSRAGKPIHDMLPHLAACRHIVDGPGSVKARARAELKDHKAARHQRALQASQENLPPSGIQPHFIIPSTPLTRTSSFSRTASLPSGVLAAAGSLSSNSSLGSIASDDIDTPTRFAKRPRTSMVALDSRIWSSDLRRDFTEDWTRVLLSMNAAFNTVEDPQLRKFMHKWIPGAPNLSRHQVSGPVLDRLSQAVIRETTASLKGRLVTGQCDGWKNKAKTSVVASMITAGSEAHIVRTHDVSAHAKTGDELLKIVNSDIEHAEALFGVSVIAWCSDDGGDGRKMRRLLASERRSLIVILCWAHQLNLVVGDVLSLKISLFDCVTQAIEVVKWFNSHSRALGILNQEQASLSANTGAALILALILPVLTRWTAHFCSLSRLERVAPAIRSSWMKYSNQLLAAAGTRREAKEKAESIKAIVENPDFWKNIAMYVTCLTLASCL